MSPALIWTEQRIIDALQEWARIYGQPPTTVDWAPNIARARGNEEQARRFEEGFARGDWPWFSIVITRFGSWNRGLAAAELPTRPRRGGR